MDDLDIPPAKTGVSLNETKKKTTIIDSKMIAQMIIKQLNSHEGQHHVHSCRGISKAIVAILTKLSFPGYVSMTLAIGHFVGTNLSSCRTKTSPSQRF